MPEYSVWNPATSSVSASARSNGGRFVSAIPQIRYTTNAGNIGTTFHTRSCAATISENERWPLYISTATSDEPHRDLVGDHLRGRADGAEERIVRAARPSREHHAVDGDRGHREDPQDADVEVDELQRELPAEQRDVVAERDRAEREERREHREDGGEQVDRLVRVRRDDALLEEELDPVGERDQDAARPRAHRALPGLEVGDHLPLEPDVEQHGDQQREEDDHDPGDQQEPVEPVHLARTPRARPRPIAPSAGASTVDVAVDREATVQERVRREPGLVERDEDRSLRDVLGDADRAASPPRPTVVTRTPAPSATPAAPASSGWISTNGVVGERRLQLVGALGQPALVHEQRVREERQSLAGLDAGRRSRPASATRERPRRSRRQELPHLLVELVQRLEAQVTAAREREAREDLPVGQGHARADRGYARMRWPRPSHVVTCPSFSRKAAAGRNASAKRLERAELERLHDLDAARSAAPAGRAPRPGKSRSGSTPTRNSTSISRLARTPPGSPRQSRPGSRTVERPPDVSTSARSSCDVDRGRRAGATGARRRRARRDRSRAA